MLPENIWHRSGNIWRKDEMKSKIQNIFAITGIALVLLSVIAQFYGGRFLCIETVYQVLGVCTAIQLVLMLLRKFESPYFIVEILLEIGAVLVLILVSGAVFHWYDSLPAWVLIIMGVAVYLTGCAIDIFQIQNEVKMINHYLKK